MKGLKHRFNFFLPYDRAGMERYLEKQAAQGWMIEGISPRGTRWIFRRSEPQELRFSVTFPPPSVGKEEDYMANRRQFQELYEHDGWESVFATEYLHVFCNRNSDSAPPETDAVVELSSLHRWTKKNLLVTGAVSTVILLLLFCFALWQFTSSPVAFLSSPSKIVICIACFLALFATLWEMGKYVFWHRRAGRCVQRGEELPSIRGNVIFSSVCSITAYLLLMIGRFWDSEVIYIAVIFLLCALFYALIYVLRYLLMICKMDKHSATIIAGVIVFCVFFFGLGLFFS